MSTVKMAGGAIVVEVRESSTHAANTNEESPQQPRGPKGAYVNKNIPVVASEWKVIHIYVLNYLEEVQRMISKDFKGNFYGKETEWHKLDRNLFKHLYKCFQVVRGKLGMSEECLGALRNIMVITHEFRRCPLRVGDDIRSAILLHLEMGDFDIILGMDWLTER
ncbi:retrotransposon protein, putative, ty3-gypsy subclass [Tanacetum coccineum]